MSSSVVQVQFGGGAHGAPQRSWGGASWRGVLDGGTRPERDRRRPRPSGYCLRLSARKISRLDLTTLELEPLVSEFNGTRLNGPNDIVLDRHSQRLYFTDPIYAYLEKHRLRDSGSAPIPPAPAPWPSFSAPAAQESRPQAGGPAP
uniref:Uncharacterized protein n=1 Tax=Tetraselmis sp. GSL018 TaxID=582737 RepID=A0A061QXZ1_9CHLO